MYSSAAKALQELVEAIVKKPSFHPGRLGIGWSSGYMTNGIKYCIVQIRGPDGEYHIEATGEEAIDLEDHAGRISSQLTSSSTLRKSPKRDELL